jgi:hypothetical protein
MTTERRSEPPSSDADAEGRMRARRWCIAATFGEPSDYGVPDLPTWTVYRGEDGTLALGEGGRRFISAADPVRVRR